MKKLHRFLALMLVGFSLSVRPAFAQNDDVYDPI
jgi:hypothetical protein